MQRVATELFAAMEPLPQVELKPLVLRSTWAATHVKTPFFLLRVLREVRRAVKRGEVDVVLFSSLVTASVAVPLRRLLRASGVPAAAIVHGQDATTPFGPYQRFVRRVFGALQGVLPVSRATGQECLDRGLAPGELYVVPNGVDLSRFPEATPEAVATPDRAALYAAFQGELAGTEALPEGALLLCSVGRQVERKGFAWFAEHVMPRLPEHVHYWLAGDGPEADAIRAAAERAGVADRVRLLGRVSEAQLRALYRGADLFVMPNVPVPGTMEGFGVVLLEAGLCGLPAVASRLEGIADVIAEGENGHFAESGDADAFARLIGGYDEDREALAAARSRASGYVADTFSWNAVARQYVSTLDSLRTDA
jgi:phosphatidylinositol alpha-1,6-mannosyltransferase